MTHGAAIPPTQAVFKLTCTRYQGHINCETDSLLAIASERGATENSHKLCRLRIHLPLSYTAFCFTPWLTKRNCINSLAIVDKL
jgi:hypothetical protein